MLLMIATAKLCCQSKQQSTRNDCFRALIGLDSVYSGEHLIVGVCVISVHHEARYGFRQLEARDSLDWRVAQGEG